MATLKREAFFIINITDTAKAVKVDGYTFEVEVHDGLKWAYGVNKDRGGKWHLTDIITGLHVRGPIQTRRECVEVAESESLKTKMWEYYRDNTEVHLAKAEVFRMLVAGQVMSHGEYIVTVDEIAAMKRESAETEEVVETAAEVAVVTLESMKELAWPDTLVQQKREGACIWVTGNVAEHADELKEMGFRPGRSKEYGRGWWLKPQVA